MTQTVHNLEDARGMLIQKYRDPSITWQAMLTLMNAAAYLRHEQLEEANYNLEVIHVGV